MPALRVFDFAACAVAIGMAVDAAAEAGGRFALGAWLCVLLHLVAGMLFLLRRPPRALGPSKASLIITSASYSYAYALDLSASTTCDRAWLLHASDGLALVGLIGCLWSTLALGRAYGVFPADRGLVKAGPYAVVRHPLYACYLVLDLSVLLSNPCTRNALVVGAGLLLFGLRIQLEERTFSASEYATYKRDVRYRLLPLVY